VKRLKVEKNNIVILIFNEIFKKFNFKIDINQDNLPIKDQNENNTNKNVLPTDKFPKSPVSNEINLISSNNQNIININSSINQTLIKNGSSTANVNKNKLLSSLPPNFNANFDNSNKNLNVDNYNKKNVNPKNEQKGKKQKSGKNKKDREDNWEEIENMLDNFKLKDKNQCNFTGCASEIEIRECVFCYSNFCNQHVRQPIHDCIYLKNMPNFNADYYKNKINKKIDTLEKERNKKENSKKK